MGRMVADRVVSAYEKLQLSVARGAWTEVYKGQKCVCGLTAVVMAETGADFESLQTMRDKQETLTELLSDRFELSKDYVTGFICGFDGLTILTVHEYKADYLIGHSDGKAAWKAVEDHAITV